MRNSSGALKVLVWIAISFLAVTAAKFKRPKCNANEFMCDNQERCIHQFNKCDGIKDCPDGSDETLANCWSFGQSCGVTQPNAFKCAYGACIDGFKECDRNKFDCADNSDEEHCPTDPPDVTSRCQSSEFTCKSGGCISLNDVCDGEPNCDDKSDETIAQCAVMRCSPFSFQCAYGACIDWHKRCNGREDCVGGSDEAPDLCNRPVDAPEDANINKGGDSNSTGETCPFPSDEHTKYTLGCKGAACQDKVPGSPVEKGSAIIVSCPPGYALPQKYERRNYMACLKPPDFHVTIKCEKICPPLVSNYHNLECKFKGKVVPCDRPMHPGTVAHLECKSHFKPQSDIKAVTQTQCLPDGTWLDDLYKCIPECGRRLKVKQHNKVSNGFPVFPGEAPWYAGFWRLKNGTYEHFCGGTVIGPNLIITAAHCLTDFRESDFNRNTDDIKNIRVALAKFNSKWEVRGEFEQRVGIKNFKEPRGYSGPPFYEKDFAVVELLEDLTLNNYVLPACVDWEKEGIIRGQPQGYIVGFGKNEHNVPSETLQDASLFYISRNDCSSRIQASTGGRKQSIMWDQFCAGADFDTSTQKLTSVQQGDSGGGYTFKRNNKYYLIGVLSHHLEDEHNYAIYTNVPEHIDWLKENGFDEMLV